MTSLLCRLSKTAGEDGEEFNVLLVDTQDNEIPSVSYKKFSAVDIHVPDVSEPILDEANSHSAVPKMEIEMNAGVVAGNTSAACVTPGPDTAEVLEQRIEWHGHASSVQVVGEFSNWEGLSLAEQEPACWTITLKQTRGSHLLR